MEVKDKEIQSQGDKAIAARTIRVERAQNGFIVKRADGHFIYATLQEAFHGVELYFESQKGGK